MAKRARRHTTRRTALTLIAAAAVLLTGCSGGDGGTETADQSRGGAAPPPPAAPAPLAPGGGAAPEEAADGGAEARDGLTAPAPADMLSTFALDVDTASYSYARRTIAAGALPQPGAVRHEEFVNSFRQDYPEPAGDGFTVTADGARAGEAAADGWSLLRVGLATRSASNEYGTARRAPAALTFVVDVSGSMAEPGRLDLAREALHTAVDELRADDSLALVSFSAEARTLLPMTRVGGAEDRIHDAVEQLRPTDSTNVEAGVVRGYDEAAAGLREGATNRVVLLSDALANTGATEASTILDRIAEARQSHGITLFGVGVGSEYGDALMERLTNEGDGHTTYVSDSAQAREVFVDDLPRNVELRARDAKAQVAFDPATVADHRLIGYENRLVADQDFRNDAVDGGEVGPGHTVTALYAVRLHEGAAGHVATATVRWLDPDTRAPYEESSSVDAAALGGELWGVAPPRLQLAALAAYFADALRGGSQAGQTPQPQPPTTGEGEGYGKDGAAVQPLPGAPTVEALAAYAAKLAAQTEDPDVVGLAETVDRAVRLTA